MTDTAPLTVVNVIAYLAYIGGFGLALWALVRGIDRLDRWGRKHDLRIVVPEQGESNVIVLDERRSA